MAAAVPEPGPVPFQRLDLRGTPCPVNFIRSKLALEAVPLGDWLEVILDAGEPDRLVSEGLRGAGHRVTAEPLPEGGVRLLIRRHGG
ncbi:MAG: sulfurtransferase TusA family protein [Cyanobacteriota bacterium]